MLLLSQENNLVNLDIYYQTQERMYYLEFIFHQNHFPFTILSSPHNKTIAILSEF